MVGPSRSPSYLACMRRLWSILAALVLLLAGLPAESRACVQQQELVGPATGEALFHLAIEARRQGDERYAATVLERVVRLDPQAVLPRLEWAEALMSLREPALVEALLAPIAARVDAEAERRPDSAARFYRIRGNVATRAGRVEDALVQYERAIGHAPTDLGLRGLVVSMYRSRGDDRAAARHLVAAASLRPGDADLRMEAGRALLGLGRFEEAEREFRVALHIDLYAVSAWTGLGEALAGQERWADAEEVVRGGLQLAPDSSPLHELLGDALLGGGRAKEALVWYTRAAALAGTTPPALQGKIERVRARLQP